MSQNAVFLGKRSRLADCETKGDDTHPFGCPILMDLVSGNTDQYLNKSITATIDVHIRKYAPIVTRQKSKWSCSVRTLEKGEKIELNGILQLVYAGDTFYWGTLEAICKNVSDMGSTMEITASPKLRSMFAVAAFIMLALWGWSLVPPIENWSNPNEDGFSYVPVFYTTIVCLPAGIYLLVGAIAGHGRYVRRARIAFFIAAGITLLVVAFLVVQQIADNNDGKVFGIQIGFQLDHQDGREM